MTLKILARVLALGAGIAWPWHCSAGPELDVQSATNCDGSALRIKTLTDEEGGQRKVWIYFRKPGDERMELIATNTFLLQDQMAAGLTLIEDWDKNGTHEVSVVVTCGAGPNCDSLLYRIDPQTARMVRIFRGNIGFVEYMHGHLVEYSRSSCCSWSANVYAVSPDRTSIAQKPEFSAHMGIQEPTVQDSIRKGSGRQTDEIRVQVKGEEAVICYFFVQSPAGHSIRIKPPAKFRKICNFYRPFDN